MSAKLFAAGAVLTVLAFASEKYVPQRQGTEPARAEATTLAVHAVSGVGTAFERVTSSAVRQMLRHTDDALEELRPAVDAASDNRGTRIRELYARAEELSLRAKQELEAGRTFKAMDLVLATNGRIGRIKKEFERE